MKVTPALSDEGKIVSSSEKHSIKEMISVSEESGRRVVRINSSSLDILQTCLRKAEFSLLRGIKAREESPATLFGSAIHKAMEVYYSGETTERIVPPNFKERMEMLSYAQDLTEPWMDEYLVYRATRAFIQTAEPLKFVSDQNKRSIANGVYILMHYFLRYIEDPYVVLRDERGPLVERKFTFTLLDSPDLKIDIFGTIDVILKNQNSGVIVVADHKTSSVVGSDFYNRLKPNHQYTTYLLGAKRALGLPCDDFLVNCIQVKEKPKTARAQPPDFPRQVTHRSDEDIKEYERLVTYWVRRYLQAVSEDYWPMGSVNACSNYGGCQYLQVCSAPDALKENIIKARFHENQSHDTKGQPQ